MIYRSHDLTQWAFMIISLENECSKGPRDRSIEELSDMQLGPRYIKMNQTGSKMGRPFRFLINDPLTHSSTDWRSTISPALSFALKRRHHQEVCLSFFQRNHCSYHLYAWTGMNSSAQLFHQYIAWWVLSGVQIISTNSRQSISKIHQSITCLFLLTCWLAQKHRKHTD